MKVTNTVPVFELQIAEQQGAKACDVLARHSGLSKQKIKDAMQKGAVWLERAGQKRKRLRRASTELKPRDKLFCYYDPEILGQPTAQGVMLKDMRGYSVWYKPPGLLSQGTFYGDHCALTRAVEQYFKPPRAVYLIHRLDREAAGLILIGHERGISTALSQLFQTQDISKDYMAWVRGRMPAEGRFDSPIESKAAGTEYRLLRYLAGEDASLVRVRIGSGRKHQIRIHFAEAGHAVLGDPKYGVDNKNASGMKLVSCCYSLPCPQTKRPVRFDISEYAEKVLLVDPNAPITDLRPEASDLVFGSA